MPRLSVWKYLVTDRLIYRNIPPVNLRLAQLIRTVPPCSTYLDLIATLHGREHECSLAVEEIQNQKGTAFDGPVRTMNDSTLSCTGFV